MKSIFPEYYRPEQAQLDEIWKTCTFVLDANVLLSLYRLPAESRDDLFKAFEAVKKRIWVPYHAALEYQRNKFKVIADQKALVDEVSAHIDKSLGDLSDGFSGHQMIDAAQVISDVKAIFSKFKEHLKDLGIAQADVHQPDGVGEKIHALFEHKIGQAPDQAWIDASDKDGEKRFLHQIPPGFKDAKKTDKFLSKAVIYQARFGDLYVWKQILEKISGDNLKAVIFITQDTKDDWWYRIKGKTIGPHPELRAEAAGAGANHFLMYDLPQFLSFAKRHISDKISTRSIEQANELNDLPRYLHPTYRVPYMALTIRAATSDERKELMDKVESALEIILGFDRTRVSINGPTWLISGKKPIRRSDLHTLAEMIRPFPQVISIQPFPIGVRENLGPSVILNVFIEATADLENVKNSLHNTCDRYMSNFEIDWGANPVTIELREILPYRKSKDLFASLETIPGVRSVEFDPEST